MGKGEDFSQELTLDDHRYYNSRLRLQAYINKKLTKAGSRKQVKYYTKIVNKG